MIDEGQHAACVDAWLARTAKSLPSDFLLPLFDAAFRALWARTQTTLGEVTLTAIAERVLYNASETLPILAPLKVDPATGIDCRGLRGRSGSASDGELRDGLRFVMIELLTVLGNLTAEILTPELHAELAHVALPETGRAGAGAEMQPNAIESQGTAGEDKRSP